MARKALWATAVLGMLGGCATKDAERGVAVTTRDQALEARTPMGDHLGVLLQRHHQIALGHERARRDRLAQARAAREVAARQAQAGEEPR